MAGFKTWADPDILTAADVNGYLMQQVVPRFTSTTARSAAIASPATGQLSYVTGLGLQIWTGSAWANVQATTGTVTLVAGSKVVASAAVTSTSQILLTAQSLGTVTTPKALAVTARTAGTSFTITSADNTDTSSVAWCLLP